MKSSLETLLGEVDDLGFHHLLMRALSNIAFGRGHGSPDVMRTAPKKVVIPEDPRGRFECERACRPQGCLGDVVGLASEENAADPREAHGRSGIPLVPGDVEMSGEDAASLTQEVGGGRRAAVVDDRSRLVDEAVPELGDDCLERELIHGRVGWDARHDVAERDDLTELGRLPRNLVVQTPEQMHCITEEGVVVVDGDRLSADHADRRVLELLDERVDGSGRHDVVRVDKDEDRSSCGGDEEVDCRRLAGPTLLDDETYPRVLERECGNDVGRPVGASTRDDDQLDQLSERGLLGEDRLDRVGDVAFLVVCHEPDAAVQAGHAELVDGRLEMCRPAVRRTAIAPRFIAPRLKRDLHRHGFLPVVPCVPSCS